VSISAKAVLFDLDGTLIHSAPDLQMAANWVCKSRGWEEFDLQTITSFIGNGVPVLVKRIFIARGASLEGSDYQTAVMEYLAYYDNHATDLTRPYEGIVEALEWLKNKAVPLGMVTNKPEAPAVAILKELKLDHYFSTVVGGDTTPAKKPDLAPHLAACKELGLAASDTIYVGDSETDGKTAIGVNVPFVLFTGGYRNSSIEDIPHWQTVDNFGDLIDVLQKSAG